MFRHLRFRHRIGVLVVLAGIGLVTVTVVTLVLGRRSERELSGIETRYVPLIELDRDLKMTFAQITRTLEDAAAAAEDSRLADADTLQRELGLRLRTGRDTIVANGGDPDALERELRAYYAVARDVSAAMVGGAPAAELGSKIEGMGQAQRTFTAHLDLATTPDRRRLAAAFATARGSQQDALSIEIAVAIAVLVVMALLSWRITRRTVKSLHDVSMGVERVARGDFESEIQVTTSDEIGDLAREANRTAARLRDYREHIQTLLEQTQRQAEELRTASAAKSEFLSSMSHELRTPLNAVLGFAQLLERDRKEPLSPRQKERLAYVLRGGEHLLKLIDDVLDLSRIESGRVAISCAPVGLRDVLDEVATTLGPMAARAEIKLEVAPLPPSVPCVIADRTRLTQILMNFGSNAIKYGKPGGRATLEAVDGSTNVRITVIDDGIGIPSDKHDKMFEPFQRAGQETGPIEGTGIGLAISKRLAGLMNGSVGFASKAGQGSRFWVEVPAHRERAADLAATATSIGVSPLAVSGVRYKVVYVEDNPSNIAFMCELVDDLARIELLTAPTAEIGLELIRMHCPALVIMDINLPGMDGFEAVEKLRAWPETRDIPVIGLSAAALAEDTRRAEHARFHRYLTKPVKVEELTTIFEELLVHPGGDTHASR